MKHGMDHVVLHNQWKTALTSVLELSIDLKQHLIQQKIMFRILDATTFFKERPEQIL